MGVRALLVAMKVLRLGRGAGGTGVSVSSCQEGF